LAGNSDACNALAHGFPPQIRTLCAGCFVPPLMFPGSGALCAGNKVWCIMKVVHTARIA
jgi:hypothetical protein